LHRYAKRPVIVGWLLAVVVLVSFRQWQSRQGFAFVDISPANLDLSPSPSPSPSSSSSSSSPSAFSYSVIDFNGWRGCWLVYNEEVEVVIAPSISRVMQFRFRDSNSPASSPLWIQEALSGQPPNPEGKEWLNFGGDKAWPGPQSQWGTTLSNRWWPPPAVFDAGPFQEVSVRNDAVVLLSPVDPWTGLQSVRRISLLGPSMTIKTELKQVAGKSNNGINNNVSVWTVTQLKDPERMYMISQPGNSGESFTVLADSGPQQATGLPNTLTETQVTCNGEEVSLISMKRDGRYSHKIGSDRSKSMLWVGSEVILEIDSPLRGSQIYPDHGCHAEIWSNPDPLAYVELEFLGPFVQPSMRDQTGTETGHRNSLTSVYTLHRRNSDMKNIDDEVLEILKCKQS